MNPTALQASRRAFELTVGVSSGILGLFLLLMCLGAVPLLLSHFDWRVLLGMVVSGVVGAWCTQTAWRLVTGRERRGGGLLSPLVLILVGAGFAAASVAWILSARPKGRGLITLIACALICFNLPENAHPQHALA